MDLIMHKFRPRAPKPRGGSSSQASKYRAWMKTDRKRRRYTRNKTLVTLPLIPETPDLRVNKRTRGEKRVVWLSVSVEHVTATWSDEETMVRRLEEDTCPGFVSDGWNRVTWTNRAFEMMAKEEEGDEMVVWVVMKDVVPVTCKAYTCRVRMESTWRG